MDKVTFDGLGKDKQVALLEVALQMTSNPASVFGDAKKAKKVYHKLSKMVHTDAGAPNSGAMTTLNLLWDAAEEQIASGTYGNDVAVDSVSLNVGGEMVSVFEKLRETEVSAIYYGELSDGTPVNVDIAHSGNNDLLDKAAEMMRLIASLGTEQPFFYPILMCEGKDGNQSKVNVYRYVLPDGNTLSPRQTASLKQVVDGVGGTLRDKHIAWIWRKLLIAVGIMWYHGVIHAGCNPDNIIVTTDINLHGIVLDGWYFASYQQAPLVVVNDAWMDIYPPHIKDSERNLPQPGLDVYMAAKSMMWANNHLDKVLVDYFNWCAQDFSLARPDTVKMMLSEFDYRIFNVLGWQREFVKMTEYAGHATDVDWSWFW